MEHSGALPVPPQAQSDRGAVEIARIWAASGQMEVALRPDLWDDPGTWGIMLVDLARHVANAYRQIKGHDVDITLAAIREIFEAEWNRPTDTPRGQMM
jgi:hypothetical protein